MSIYNDFFSWMLGDWSKLSYAAWEIWARCILISLRVLSLCAAIFIRPIGFHHRLYIQPSLLIKLHTNQWRKAPGICGQGIEKILNGYNPKVGHQTLDMTVSLICETFSLLSEISVESKRGPTICLLINFDQNLSFDQHLSFDQLYRCSLPILSLRPTHSPAM